MAANKPSLSNLLRASSFRLTMLYAGMFMASVLVLFGVIYWWAADYAFKDETDDISAEYVAIQDEIRLAGLDKLPEIIANHIRQHADESAVYLVLDAEGHKIAGNLPEMEPHEGDLTLRTDTSHEEPAHWYRLNDGKYLLIGQDPQSLREMKQLIARAFTISLLLTVLLAVGGGVVIAGSVLRRVDTVGRTSQAIAAGDLTQRVPVSGSDDEFDTLALGINAMLDRIEDLMGSMRQVSNDIAHDLRTPLTRLRHRLEQTRANERSVDALHGALDQAIGQVDGILATFGALLRIAQIEGGVARTAPAAVDFSALLDQLADDFRPAAEDKGQRLRADIAPGLAIAGERELLVQMFANLLDNAVRHAPRDADLTIRAWGADDAVEVVVADTGPGIPSEERDKVLRPFYRLDASRTTEGSGLGLSLVAAIAKRHGATLRLADNEPGLRVSLSFRAVTTAPLVRGEQGADNPLYELANVAAKGHIEAAR